MSLADLHSRGLPPGYRILPVPPSNRLAVGREFRSRASPTLSRPIRPDRMRQGALEGCPLEAAAFHFLLPPRSCRPCKGLSLSVRRQRLTFPRRNRQYRLTGLLSAWRTVVQLCRKHSCSQPLPEQSPEVLCFEIERWNVGSWSLLVKFSVTVLKGRF